MASRRKQMNKNDAIEFVRELLGRPDASEEEIVKLAKEAIAKVEDKRITVDLRVSPAGEDARLRKVLELLLKQNNTKEAKK